MSTKTKPSLNALLNKQKIKGKRAAKPQPATSVTTVEPRATEPGPQPIDTKALRRTLLVRGFVTEYLKNDMDGAKAYRAVAPDCTQQSSWTRASEMLQQDDVRTELARQLRGIFTHADIDEEWVYRQWRSMANSNIFDYCNVDANGTITWKLDPNQLTLEQQLNIRRLKVKDGKVVDIGLVDREGTVANVARARKLFSMLEDVGMKDLAKEIAERMQHAKKKVTVFRTFDNETGEEIG